MREEYFSRLPQSKPMQGLKEEKESKRQEGPSIPTVTSGKVPIHAWRYVGLQSWSKENQSLSQLSQNYQYNRTALLVAMKIMSPFSSH
jgi:hypothetical protein